MTDIIEMKRQVREVENAMYSTLGSYGFEGASSFDTSVYNVALEHPATGRAVMFDYDGDSAHPIIMHFVDGAQRETENFDSDYDAVNWAIDKVRSAD